VTARTVDDVVRDNDRDRSERVVAPELFDWSRQPPERLATARVDACLQVGRDYSPPIPRAPSVPGNPVRRIIPPKRKHPCCEPRDWAGRGTVGH
jgi:hypothetical protein